VPHPCEPAIRGTRQYWSPTTIGLAFMVRSTRRGVVQMVHSFQPMVRYCSRTPRRLVNVSDIGSLPRPGNQAWPGLPGSPMPTVACGHSSHLA
jgi:hypothetical protein